jgi:hypothetical protein
VSGIPDKTIHGLPMAECETKDFVRKIVGVFLLLVGIRLGVMGFNGVTRHEQIDCPVMAIFVGLAFAWVPKS